MRVIVEGILLIVVISVFVVALGLIMDKLTNKDDWK
jgi:hypothetical protein